MSALAGYETVNWGEQMMPDGSRLTDGDNFIYGGALTLELSAYLTDKIVLLVNGRQRMLFGVIAENSTHRSVWVSGL